jgi:hypothetical protein
MMPSFPHAVAASSLAALEDRGTTMAKGQKRSNREAKKPKSTNKKKPAAATRSTITTAAPKK